MKKKMKGIKMKLESILDIHQYISQYVETPSCVVLSGDTKIDTEYLDGLTNILSNNIKDYAEDIILNNYLYSYFLIKDFKYSYKIVETKLNNVKFSIKKKLPVIFQVGTYEAGKFCNINSLLNLIVNTKLKLIDYKSNKLVNDKNSIKLVNDIIVLNVLLKEELRIIPNMNNITNIIKNEQNCFDIELSIAKHVLTNFKLRK